MLKRFRDYTWLKNRPGEDLRKLLQYSKKEDLAVISIDMQENCSNIYPASKEETISKWSILVKYHKKLKELCLKNDIPFIEVRHGKSSKNVLSDENTDLQIPKDKYSVVEGSNILEDLYKLKVKNLYVIGVYRNACVISSILDLRRSGYEVFTSFLGTGGSKFRELDSRQEKFPIEDIRGMEEVKKAYGEKNIDHLSLKNDIKILEQNGVIILDYYK